MKNLLFEANSFNFTEKKKILRLARSKLTLATSRLEYKTRLKKFSWLILESQVI